MNNINQKKFTVRLPKESHASAFIDIQHIIRTLSSRTEGKYIFIDFQEKTEDLNQLIEQGRTLSAFKLFIDGKPIPKNEMLYISRWALFCTHATHCQGICRVILRSFGFLSLLDITQTLDPKNPFERSTGDYQRLIESNYSWLTYIEKEEVDELKIIHDLLVNDIKKDLHVQAHYCQVFNWEAIEEKLRSLPSPVEVQPKIDNWELLFYYLEKILPESIETKMETILRKLFVEAGFIQPKSIMESSEEE